MTGVGPHLGEDPLANLDDASPLGQVVDDFAAGGKGKSTLLKLPQRFSIAELSDWQKSIHAPLDAEADIHIDRSGLEYIDGAALQFLHCLRQALADTDRVIRWQGQSEPLNETARLLGLEEF